MVSEDNLMSLPLFAHSAAALTLSRSVYNSNYWICTAKGTCAGGTPTNVDRAAATRTETGGSLRELWNEQRVKKGGRDRTAQSIPNMKVFEIKWNQFSSWVAATYFFHRLSLVILTWSHVLNLGYWLSRHIFQPHLLTAEGNTKWKHEKHIELHNRNWDFGGIVTNLSPISYVLL